MSTFYINGTTLSNSTAIFTDAALTTCADDGYYKDSSGIARQQTSCVLGPIEPCPSCATSCGEAVSTVGNEGVYLLNIDTGNSASDVGAIVVRFAPASVPDGIRAWFDGSVYNKMSSPNDGYHASTVGGNFTYVGNSASGCSISGLTFSLDDYIYVGGSFVTSGNTQSVTVAAGDVSLTLAGTPGVLIMVIPKTTQTPSLISFEIVGPCPATAWGIEVDCPIMLTPFASTTTAEPSAVDACAETINTSYFNVPVNSGTYGDPQVHDWVFSGAYGATILPDGFYKIISNDVMEVVNGVVISRASC